MKKIITLFLSLMGGSLFFLLATLSGCEKPHLYFLKSMTMIPQSSQNQTFRGPGDTCRFQDLSFQLQFETTQIAKKNSWSGNAYAFTFNGPDYINVDEITQVRLITLFDYNQFPAGSDVTALISDEEALIWALNEDKEDISGAIETSVTFTLTTPPQQLSQQQFALELISKNNTILRDTTFRFYVQP